MISTWLCPGVRELRVRFPYPTQPTALHVVSISYCTVRTASGPDQTKEEVAEDDSSGGDTVEVLDTDSVGVAVWLRTVT